ncbi:MAG: hypothetical protein HQL98_02690 [Magnetococcales bacterium]|nr:hypothetical protein [Magnetococcales bacterium]
MSHVRGEVVMNNQAERPMLDWDRNLRPVFRNPPGRRRFWLAAVGGALFFSLAPGLVESSEKDRYVESVITMLRLHAEAIRQLATHDFRYSRNLARHVSGLQHTFGLLGPMEWHVSTSITLQKKNGQGGSVLTEADFDKIAEQCQKSMKGLYQASIKQLEAGGSPEPVLKALDELQGKCTSCHSLLDGIAPDVWGAAAKGK